MTDNQNLKLARVYRTIINDIEDVLGVSITGADEHRIMQSLMDAVDAAVIMMNDSVMSSIDVEISRLEDRVVEAVVAWRRRNELKWESECIKVCNDLDDAADALIAAREKAERQLTPSSC